MPIRDEMKHEEDKVVVVGVNQPMDHLGSDPTGVLHYEFSRRGHSLQT